MTPSEEAELHDLRGPMSGRNVIGETTEALHRFLLDGWDLSENPPRIEEDLKFVPKDREEVIYIYMYRLAHNPNLQNLKRLRRAPVFVKDNPDDGGEVYLHRPPLLLDVFYYLSVHSKFRSDAERLMGWLLLKLNEATHLIYRPRKFLLPDGREVDSLGRTYDPDNFKGFKPPEDDADVEPDKDDGLHIEKVSLAPVDDLTFGDAIHLCTLHEAPYRPFLTYRARVALDGPLYRSAGGSTVRMGRVEATEQKHDAPTRSSPNGRVRNSPPQITPIKAPPGPQPFKLRKSEPTPDSEE